MNNKICHAWIGFQVTTKNYSVCFCDNISKSGTKVKSSLGSAEEKFRKYGFVSDEYGHYKIILKSRTTNYNLTSPEMWLDNIGLTGSSVN